MTAMTQLGASDSQNQNLLRFLQAKTSGPHSVQVALAGGSALGDNPLPFYGYLSCGDFIRMTGYHDGKLRNDSMTHDWLTYVNPLVKMPLLEGVYLGGSLEVARLGSPLIPSGIQGNVGSVSMFVDVETLRGPAYLAFGHTQDGNSNINFYLGKR